MSLARLLEQAAQPFPWIVLRDGDVTVICTDDGEHEIVPWSEGAEQVAPEHARLIALAPDMARLLIDMAAFMRRPHSRLLGMSDWWATREALLARFAELDGQAKEGT